MIFNTELGILIFLFEYFTLYVDFLPSSWIEILKIPIDSDQMSDKGLDKKQEMY